MQVASAGTRVPRARTVAPGPGPPVFRRLEGFFHLPVHFFGETTHVGGEVDFDPAIRVGNLALRGERGALRIPPGDMLRQRWNPFYPWLAIRIHGFCDLPATQQ